jgi:hypothetical protein
MDTMGFLDKLLGRGKQAVDTAEEKMGMHGHDHDHDHADAAAPAEPAAPAVPDPGSAPESSGDPA